MAKVGRPLKYTSVEEIVPLIEAYFEKCDVEERPYTISGLAYALETSRNTLMVYEGKDEFSNTIKKAKLKCEKYAEERLFSGGQVAGVIFNLKNNFGWKDKQEVESSGGVNITIKRFSDE